MGTPTNITLQLPPASQLGINYYHESMGYIGRSTAQITTDLTNIAQVTKNLKIYINPFTNNAGITHSQALTILTTICQIAQPMGFHLVWVENIDQGAYLTDSNWPTYCNVVTSDSKIAQQLGCAEFLVGNEIIGSSHYVSGNTTFTATNFPPAISSLVDSCRANFSGLIGYQEVNTITGMWTTNNGTVANLLHLDRIYYDLYEPFHTFQYKCQYFKQTFGNQVVLGEVSSLDVLGAIGQASAYSENDWSRELMRRYDTARQVGIPFYIFTYGDPSSTSTGFGLRLTGQDNAWHDIWQYLLNKKSLSYTQYFLDTFPSGSGSQDFSGDGTNGNGSLNVSSNNAGSFATAPSTDYVFRGQLKPYSTTGSMRMVGRYTDVNNYYCLDVNVGTSTASFIRRQNGVETVLGKLTFPAQGSQGVGLVPLATYNLYDFELRFQGTGSSTYCEAFFNTFKLYEGVDTGNTGLNSTTFGNKNQGCNGSLYQLVSSSLETITSGSSGTGGQSTPNSQVIPLRVATTSTHPQPAVPLRLQLAYVQDSFIRAATTSGWGNNLDGLAWNPQGVVATLSTDGQHGLLSSPGGGTQMLLGNQSLTDSGTLVKVMVNSVGDNPGVLARWSNTNTYYALDYLDGVGIRLRKVVGGTATTLVTQSYSMTKGVFYWLRAEVMGSTLALNVWQDGQREPAGYLVSTTDNALTSGQAGLYGNPATTTPMQYQNYVVTAPFGTNQGTGLPGGTGTIGGSLLFYPLGLTKPGRSRFGDGLYTAITPHASALGLYYSMTLSKHASTLALSYVMQRGNVAPLFLYYLVMPPSQFAINGIAIKAPDHLTYTPVPVTNRTLLGTPLLQGYRTMNWTYQVMALADYQSIMALYQPQNPVVLLTYPDQTGTWVQVRAVMLPPSYGQRQQMMVYNVALSFTRL